MIGGGRFDFHHIHFKQKAADDFSPAAFLAFG
jgi:hypothetical protein